MYVTFPQALSILEYFEFGRFGTIDVGLDPPDDSRPPCSSPARRGDARSPPRTPAERITLDDGRSTQNPDPAIHPNGDEFTLANTFRGGDLLTNITGHPRLPLRRVDGAADRGRRLHGREPTTRGPRGWRRHHRRELQRPELLHDARPTRRAAARTPRRSSTARRRRSSARSPTIDADVFGLIEIENNGTAVRDARRRAQRAPRRRRLRLHRDRRDRHRRHHDGADLQARDRSTPVGDFMP